MTTATDYLESAVKSLNKARDFSASPTLCGFIDDAAFEVNEALKLVRDDAAELSRLRKLDIGAPRQSAALTKLDNMLSNSLTPEAPEYAGVLVNINALEEIAGELELLDRIGKAGRV